MDYKQFDRIYKRYYHEVALHANRLVNNHKIAEEIASESFMKFWNHGNNLTNSKEIRNYLFLFAGYSAKRHLTKNQNEIRSLQEYLHTIENSLSFGDELQNEYDIQELNARINILPVRLKKVIELSMQGLNNIKIASQLGISNSTVYALKNKAYKILRTVLLNNSTEPSNDAINSINLQQINIKEDEINAALIKHLAKHPHKMYDLDPYKFEKLVAALMKDMGYDVYHTSQTRDGGRDIIAVMKTPSNDPIVTIVECKRNRTDRAVSIDIVERFIYTIRDKDKANAGWIVTTSTFSTDAINKQQEYKWLLSLKDNNHLTAWCNNYGQWKRSGKSGGLWLPNNPLA